MNFKPFRGCRIAALLAIGALRCTFAQSNDYAVGVPIQIWYSDGTNLAYYIPRSPSQPSSSTFAYAVPGQSYTISYGSSSGSISVAVPPGYRPVLNNIISNSCPGGSMTLRIIPSSELQPAVAGFASPISGSGVYWRLSLGTLLNGDAAGYLEISDTGTESSWSALYTPAALSYETTSTEVFSYMSGGNIRQIIGNTIALDIVTINSTCYQIRCYNPVQLAAGGPCTFTGSPFAVYNIQQGSSSCSLQITRTTYNISDPYATSAPASWTDVTTLARTGSWPTFSWSKTDWTSNGESAIVGTSVTGSGTTSSRSEAVSVGVPGGPVARNLTRNYTLLPCGEVLASEVVGSTSAATASFSYYSDSTQPGNYGYLQSESKTGGQWQAFDYYDPPTAQSPAAGNVVFRYRPFNNAPAVATHDPNQGEATYYEYGPDPFGFMTRPTLIRSYINGIVTAQSTISYSGTSTVTATKNDYSGSSGYLQTVSKFYAEDTASSFVRQKPISNTQPDGMMQSYAYALGNWNGSTFSPTANGPGSLIAVITGTTNSSAGTSCSSYNGISVDTLYLVTSKSTAEVTIRDNRALVVQTDSYAWTGSAWQLVTCTNYTYNFAGLPTGSVSSNGATTSSTYDGLLKTSDTDASGVTTSYTYDAAGRVSISTRAGSGAIPTVATQFSYDAINDVVTQRVGWGQTEQRVTTNAYDDSGRIVASTPPGLGTTTYAYDPADRIITQTNPDGGTVINTTGIDGRPTSVTGSSVIGQYMTYGVETTGNTWSQINTGSASSPRWQKSWKDWLGRDIEDEHPGEGSNPNVVAENTYNSTTGQLTESTKTGYANTYYTYDALGSLYQTGLDVDADGSLVLASNARISQTNTYIESYSSNWWLRTDTATYPTASSSTPVTTSTVRNRLTGFATGQVAETQATDAEGNVTDQSTTLNPATLTAVVTTTSSGYADPQVQTALAGIPVSSKTYDGLTTSTTYDNLMRPNTVTDSRGNVTTTAYISGTSLVYTVTDATSAVLQTDAYDGLGRIVSQENASGHYALTAYNLLGQVVQQWGDGALPVSYTYDATYGDKLTMSTYRAGTGWGGSTWPSSPGTADTTTWAYDPATGLQTSKTDATSHAVTQTYNSRGQTATRTLARGTVTTYGYDSNTGELLSQSYSDSTPTVTYTYNRQGKMATIADATGTRTLVYDSTDPWRMDNEELSSYYGSKFITRLYASTQVIGRVNGFQVGNSAGNNADLEQDYTFTSDGRFNSITSGSNSNAAQRTFTYGYLANSPLVNSLSVSDGPFVVSRTFETQRNLLTSVEADWGSTDETRYAYTYNALQQRSTAIQSGQAYADYVNAIYRSFVYDSKGELTSALCFMGSNTSDTSQPLPGRQDQYDYDSIGNRLTANRTGVSGLAENYTANSLNQYTAKDNNTVNVSGTASTSANVVVSTNTSLAGRQGTYWSDELAVSNGTGPWHGPITIYAGKPNGGPGGTTDLAQINSRTGQIPAVSQTFTYDADGDLTDDGVWSYTWDGENRLIQMQTDSAAATAGYPNLQLQFQYDYLGRRVQKRVVNLTSSTEITSRRYLYDGWNLVAEYTAPGGTSFGALVRTYTWGLDIARSLTDAGGVGALVQITDQGSGNSYFPTYDGNGNVMALVNGSSGAIAAAYEYDPYGQPLRSQTIDQVVADQPFRFSTKFTDLESGLVYYGHRYYDPRLGRFVCRDPEEETGGLNLYGFVTNDPINKWDRLGYADNDWGSCQSGNGGLTGLVSSDGGFGSSLAPYSVSDDSSGSDDGEGGSEAPTGILAPIVNAVISFLASNISSTDISSEMTNAAPSSYAPSGDNFAGATSPDTTGAGSDQVAPQTDGSGASQSAGSVSVAAPAILAPSASADTLAPASTPTDPATSSAVNPASVPAVVNSTDNAVPAIIAPTSGASIAIVSIGTPITEGSPGWTPTYTYTNTTSDSMLPTTSSPGFWNNTSSEQMNAAYMIASSYSQGPSAWQSIVASSQISFQGFNSGYVSYGPLAIIAAPWVVAGGVVVGGAALANPVVARIGFQGATIFTNAGEVGGTMLEGPALDEIPAITQEIEPGEIVAPGSLSPPPPGG